MEKDPPEGLLVFLTRYPRPVVEVYLGLRDRVYEIVPEATEIITNASYTVACGYTFTHSIKQAFMYVGAYSKHVNLGFVGGNALSDPESRLKGEGKFMRHLSYHSIEDHDDLYGAEMIVQAANTAVRPAEPLHPKTVITVMKKSLGPP